jgi:hypothetical protein
MMCGKLNPIYREQYQLYSVKFLQTLMGVYAGEVQ